MMRICYGIEVVGELLYGVLLGVVVVFRFMLVEFGDV